MAKILTTGRGKFVKLLTPEEWRELLYGEYGGSNSLAAFERMVLQSRDYKVCIKCLTPNNLVERPNHLLPTDGYHSKDYYMCQECEETNERDIQTINNR